MIQRKQILGSGLAGVAAGMFLTGLAAWVVLGLGLQPLINGPGIWLLLVFVLFFSLVEMPLMILSLRWLAGGTKKSQWLIMLTGAAFVFFAAFYAAPFTLLTGRIVLGTAVASLCLARLAGMLLFVNPAERQS